MCISLWSARQQLPRQHKQQRIQQRVWQQGRQQQRLSRQQQAEQQRVRTAASPGRNGDASSRGAVQCWTTAHATNDVDATNDADARHDAKNATHTGTDAAHDAHGQYAAVKSSNEDFDDVAAIWQHPGAFHVTGRGGNHA